MASVPVYIRDFRAQIPGQLSSDLRTWEFPTIYGANKHKKDTFWTIYVRLFYMREDIVIPDIPADAFIPIKDAFFGTGRLDENLCGWINIDSGIKNKKTKKSVPTIIKTGKNIGKISETNVWTQALRDAYGLYNKQLKKSTNANNMLTSTKLYPPMLAQVLKGQLSEIIKSQPLYVQRKYNGVRTVTTLDYVDDFLTSKVIMYSRRRNIYPGFQHIKHELSECLRKYWQAGQHIYIDGEIYKHGVALQTISGDARKEGDVDIKYEYMVYDCFIPEQPELKYSDRKKILDELFISYEFTYTKIVETFAVFTDAEVYTLYESFITDGFEGAMIRTDDAYQYSYNDYHSKVLLKLKPTLDAEYTIVDWTTGEKGKSAEALMIICTTSSQKLFLVTPAMDLLDRIALEKKMHVIEPNGKTHFENHWLGKQLIVYFDELSEDGIPQRARTKMELRPYDQ